MELSVSGLPFMFICFVFGHGTSPTTLHSSCHEHCCCINNIIVLPLC
jgi:hypothetical protein